MGIILLVLAVLCSGAGWKEKDSWRKLRKGLSEEEIVRDFGQPKRMIRWSGGVYYLYQPHPYVIKEPKNNKIPIHKRRVVILHGKTEAEGVYPYDEYDTGYICFLNKNRTARGVSAGSPVYIVSRWKEPDFSNVQNDADEKPKEYKPKRPLKKYEQETNWLKLKAQMPMAEAVEILGVPEYKEEPGGGVVTIYYGDIADSAGLRFKKDFKLNAYFLEAWKEPYWFILNSELYNEVEGTDTEN